MATERLPGDTALPQLEIAWDADRMLEIFRRHLRPVGEKHFQIKDCRLSRFRYRAGQRSIVLYELCLREPMTGEVRTQWVTGVMYAEDNRAKRIYRRVLETEFSENVPSPWQTFQPVTYLPELEMLVQVFPMDRYLTTLPKLLRGPTAELEHTLLKEFGGGDWRLQSWQVEPVRYRPFLGVTLCCTVEAENVANHRRRFQSFYIKVYRDDGGRRAGEFLRRLETHCSRHEYPFATVRPITYLEDLRALVLAAAPGQSLEQVLISGENVPQAMSQTARALAALHQSDLIDGHSRVREQMLARAKRAVSFIQWACPAQRAKAGEILRILQARFEDVEACPTHLDVKADHIFLDDGHTVFIDLDSFGVADPVFDLATLLVRLRAMPDLLPVMQTTADEATQTLIEEYFRQVPAKWRERLPVNYALAALRVSLYYIQHQEPNWPRRVGHLIDETTSILSDRVYWMQLTCGTQNSQGLAVGGTP